MNERMNAVIAQWQWLTATTHFDTALKMMVAVISILASMVAASWAVTSFSTTPGLACCLHAVLMKSFLITCYQDKM